MAAADVEAVDFEPEEDDLMDEDGLAAEEAPHPKLKSAITGAGGDSSGFTAKKTKGRGFREDDADRNSRLTAREFESLDSDGGPGPARCQFSFDFSLCSSLILLIFLGFIVVFLVGLVLARVL